MLNDTDCESKMCSVENLVLADSSLEIGTADSTNKYWIMSQDNLVGIETRYRLDSQGIRNWFPAGIREFFLLHSDHTGTGAHQASHQLGSISHEAEHSSLESAMVMNACSYSSTPTYLFIVWCWIKHRDYF